MQYLLQWTLGLGPNEDNGWKVPKPQKKADKGTICHKALEILASRKLALQEGRATFTDDETGLEFTTASLEPGMALDAAWEHYTKSITHFTWDAKDYRDCRKWTMDALAYNNGLFNPANRQVLWPEKRFEFTIEEPWARYRYDLGEGRELSGNLAIKGTLDLVCRDNDVVELIDWKTGQRKDWATGKRKEYRDFLKDPQLRLYHYALARLCPWARQIIITIVYIRDGGPFSLPFAPADLEKTEAMIRQRFESIRDCVRPKRIMGDRVHGWKCSKLCQYFMNDWPGTKTNVCDYIQKELVSLGMDKLAKKYVDIEKITQYGSGGGRTSGK